MASKHGSHSSRCKSRILFFFSACAFVSLLQGGGGGGWLFKGIIQPCMSGVDVRG